MVRSDQYIEMFHVISTVLRGGGRALPCRESRFTRLYHATARHVHRHQYATRRRLKAARLVNIATENRVERLIAVQIVNKTPAMLAERALLKHAQNVSQRLDISHTPHLREHPTRGRRETMTTSFPISAPLDELPESYDNAQSSFLNMLGVGNGPLGGPGMSCCDGALGPGMPCGLPSRSPLDPKYL